MGRIFFTMAVQPLVPALCTALWLCAHKQPWLNRKRRGAGILKGVGRAPLPLYIRPMGSCREGCLRPFVECLPVVLLCNRQFVEVRSDERRVGKGWVSRC